MNKLIFFLYFILFFSKINCIAEEGSIVEVGEGDKAISNSRPGSEDKKKIALKTNISIISPHNIYQISSVIAEEFSKRTKFRTPSVEFSGNAIGFKNFCDLDSSTNVLITLRKINDTELQFCNANKIGNLEEILVGYDVLILAHRKSGERFNITVEDLFKAIAKNIPLSGDNGIWAKNEHRYWNEINKDLPRKEIEILAPSKGTSADSAIVNMIIERYCLPFCCPPGTSYSDMLDFCSKTRDDARYKIGNDLPMITIKKLLSNPDSIGLISYYSYVDNQNSIDPISIDGISPSQKTIDDGSYKLSRPVFVYIKSDHLSNTRGLKEFLAFITNDKIVGKDGIMSQKGILYGSCKNCSIPK